MAKFAQMEAELASQEKDHKEQIYQLERKQVVDKDRWGFDFRRFKAGLLTSFRIWYTCGSFFCKQKMSNLSMQFEMLKVVTC